MHCGLVELVLNLLYPIKPKFQLWITKGQCSNTSTQIKFTHIIIIMIEKNILYIAIYHPAKLISVSNDLTDHEDTFYICCHFFLLSNNCRDIALWTWNKYLHKTEYEIRDTEEYLYFSQSQVSSNIS